MLERLAAAAAGFLEEGSADTRAAGRRMIWRLAAAAGGAEGLARLLARAPGGAERRRLALEALGAALTPEGLLQAMPAGASAPYGPDGLFLSQAPGTPEADSAQARGTPDRGRRRSAAPVPAQPVQSETPYCLGASAYPGMQTEAQLRPGRLHTQPAGPASAAASEGGGTAPEHAPPVLALQGYATAYAARRPRRSSADS